MEHYKAEVLAHTRHPTEGRAAELVSLGVRFPRYILPEVNTYRTFSRCYQSSRAVPTAKLLEQVVSHPVVPPLFGREQRGMVMCDTPVANVEGIWLEAATNAASHTSRLQAEAVHKSVQNRIIEPFLTINGVITAELAAWAWFLEQRLSSDADPAIKKFATKVYEAISKSTAEEKGIHLPYIDEEETHLESAPLVSAARCARNSYTPHGKVKKDCEADLRLAERLVQAGHFSPFEHVATPCIKGSTRGNFTYWDQERSVVDNRTQDAGMIIRRIEEFFG